MEKTSNWVVVELLQSNPLKALGVCQSQQFAANRGLKKTAQTLGMIGSLDVRNMFIGDIDIKMAMALGIIYQETFGSSWELYCTIW